MLSLLIILLLIGLVAQTASADYELLTKEEVENWLDSITFEELTDFIIRYDYVENTIPLIEFPVYIILIEGRDVYIQHQDNMKIKIGHLEYKVELENQKFEKIIPEEKILKKMGISFGAGLLSGVIFILLIL